MEIGVSLGADVPVFLFGKNALGEGIGERLTLLDLPPPGTWSSHRKSRFPRRKSSKTR
jgi:4-diphosphocytidyl-2-C-methyl-D-erythritol kinase